jgi:ATP-dependent Lhr-like helicase
MAIPVDANTPLLDRLRLDLVQTVTAIELLSERWCEPPDPLRLHLSTLIQQLLSLIAQHGGAQPDQAYGVLCGRGGPFTNVTPKLFADLLRALGGKEIISQSHDGLLLLGERGEPTVNHYTFYTAFQTPEEYRLVSAGRQLGTMPIHFPLYEGLLLIFAARRWRVLAVHPEDKAIQLTPAAGGRPPTLGGSAAEVHAVVRRRMRTTLESDTVPGYLDDQSRTLLAQARREYAARELGTTPVVTDGSDTVLFAWTGDRVLNTLAEILNTAGMEAAVEGPAVRLMGTTKAAAVTALSSIADNPPPNPIELASRIRNKEIEKFDAWLSESLLNEQYACARLDCLGATDTAKTLRDMVAARRP